MFELRQNYRQLMPRKNISETRAWTHFTSLLILCLIVFLVVAHFVGPRLVQLSDLIPTQTLRAQIHLLQEAQKTQSSVQNLSSTDVIILGDSTASRSLAAEKIEKKLARRLLQNLPYHWLWRMEHWPIAIPCFCDTSPTTRYPDALL